MRPRRFSRSRRLSPQVIQRSGSAHEGGGHVRLLPARLRHPLRLVSWHTARLLNSATTSLLHRFVLCVRIYHVAVFSPPVYMSWLSTRRTGWSSETLRSSGSSSRSAQTHTHRRSSSVQLYWLSLCKMSDVGVCFSLSCQSFPVQRADWARSGGTSAPAEGSAGTTTGTKTSCLWLLLPDGHMGV